MIHIPCEELRVGDVLYNPHPHMSRAVVTKVDPNLVVGGVNIGYVPPNHNGNGYLGSWLRAGERVWVLEPRPEGEHDE